MLQIRFETFRDGIVELYDLADDGSLGDKIGKFRFGNRSIGNAAYLEALTAQQKISRKIRIRMFQKIDEDNRDYFRAVINGNVYKVARVQHYQGNRPAVSDLTLQMVRGRE